MQAEASSLFSQWNSRLRACSEVSEAAGILACAAGEMSGSLAAGVFLLDQEGKRLLPTAFWAMESNRLQLGPEQCAEQLAGVENACAVQVEQLEDPLSFCLHNGKLCLVQGLASFKSTSLQLLSQLFAGTAPVKSGDDFAGKAEFKAGAFPLIAPGGITLGGILLAGPGVSAPSMPELDKTGVLELLCDYGAAVLDAGIKRRRSSSVVNSLHEDLARLQEETSRIAAEETDWGIIGQSQIMRSVRGSIRKAASSAVSVLITGETGTGKELVASAIHAVSPRREHPFVQINCAAMPGALLESELFGYRKGAFSGANRDHAGILRSADKGTLLLDEIGDMPLDLQAKLLRFLQEREVRPVGDTRSYPVDLRILASTNCDLQQAIASGGFRRDLYHRLAVFPISLPPLRERLEDIPLLAEHFIRRFAAQYQRPDLFLEPESLRHLCSLPHLGNVRELAASIERAVLLADRQTSGLKPELFADDLNGLNGGFNLPDRLAAYEQAIINSTLEQCSGNVSLAASSLGIPRRTLAHKLQKNVPPVPEKLPEKLPEEPDCQTDAEPAIKGAEENDAQPAITPGKAEAGKKFKNRKTSLPGAYHGIDA